MRRGLPVPLLAAVLAAVIAAAVVASVPVPLPAAVLAAPATASPLRDTAVGVGEREFTLTPYRRTVPRGIVRFNVTNYGEDTHDLTVLDAKGRTVAHSPEIQSSTRFALRAKLKRPGVYRLLCTIADHAARGMRARIRIVSR